MSIVGSRRWNSKHALFQKISLSFFVHRLNFYQFFSLFLLTLNYEKRNMFYSELFYIKLIGGRDETGNQSRF